ncbi:MAG: adenosylmethionine--8-amino-7-oxononanoate transaminase [Myxococcales bacterium]|nr:adenosylmethionine--8-amino-7-oxononanoate transaminase [Myxococcales bacterium]
MTTLRELDSRYLWHPFTQMAAWAAEEAPIIVAGEGSELIDEGGRRYLDGVSSLWCNVHGHRHPALDSALRAQLGKIAHTTMLGLSNEPAIRLAERLIAVAPAQLTRVFYSDSGSTAVEVALKMAFQYWQQVGAPQRTEFVAFENAYHGDTIGSVSLGGIDRFHQLYRPLLFDAHRVPYPGVRRWPLDRRETLCDDHIAPLRQLLRERAERIAAVVVEPLVQGAAGIITAPDGFLGELRRLCDEHRVLLIVDEVATGFGRTGTLFACEHEAVSPDVLCLAKGISGGYLPLAATLTREAIYEAFLGAHDEFRTFFHGHTYTGNPLACAVGLASLELFESERRLEQVGARIGQLEAWLPRLLELDHVAEVRQRGLMLGIELQLDVPRGTPYPVAERRGHQVVIAARRRGAVIRPLGDTIVLMPPLAIGEAELASLLEITRQSIVEATA